MNVVDSSVWLEYLSDGPSADFFVPPIEDEENLVTPTICIFEVFKRVLVELGEERALNAVGTLSRGNVVELNREEAIEAARLSAQFKLAMADSIILATARTFQATLWTQDAHFKDIEGVRYIEKK
jgi:predicted nucleic acid-binding protein